MSSPNILIVEDSLTQAMELQIILEGADYTCTLARDGIQGLAAFNDGNFDLVLTDIQMPGLSGYDLTRAIKDKNADIPVILLTALSAAKDIMLGLECGADNFVTKPYEAEYLLERIEQSLKNKEIRHQKGHSDGVDVVFQKENYKIRGQSEQLVDFLVSTFDDYLRARQREAEARLSETEQKLKAETIGVQEELIRKRIETERVTETAKILAAKAEELRLSEERFNLAIEGSHDGIWDWDLLHQTCFYSDKCKEQLGYDPSEIADTKEALAALVHPDDLERINQCAQKHLETRTPYDIEFRARTKSGQYKWIHSRGQAIWDENGKPLRMAGSHRDITQRIEYEQRLAEREAQVKAIFSGMSDGIYQVDSQGLVVYLNPSAERILGYKKAEILGKNMHATIHATKIDGSVTPNDDCPIVNVIRTGTTFQTDSDHFINSRGQYIPVEYSSSPIYQVGKIIGAVVTFRDITERKESERRVREFYSTVSHELRTPLTSIRGSLGLIEGGLVGEISPKTQQFIQIARVESDRLIRLINDILDISKIEAGKLDLKIRELDPSELLETTIQSMNGFAEQNSVSLTSSSTVKAKIPGDLDRLTQVLTNLISNAVKFTPENSTVDVRLVDKDKDHIRFEVQDQGTGIPEDKKHLLFGKFQQIDSTDTRKRGGTGLGLAVSKAIIEEHKGVIGFDSEEGKGSTFWFELPIVKSSMEVVRPRTGGYATISDEPETATILVIEDDSATREVLIQQLQMQDYKCTAAKTGVQGLRIVREENPDLVILNLDLPDMTGSDIINAVRAQYPEKRILVYTSQDLSREEVEELDSPYTKCLVKSKATQQDIYNTIRFLLKK